MTNEFIAHREDSAADPDAKPGVDPRIAALKEKATVSKLPSDEPISATTLTDLCDRLNQVDSYAASLGGHLTGLNDRLAGAVPQASTAGSKGAPDNPSGCLGYAHAMIDELNRRLQYIEGELKRLDRNIGE